jgi:uncharacterized protein YndB with AHSA1/START domain
VSTIELERTLVKSPPELWDEIASEEALGRWLGEVSVSAVDPPSRIEWNVEGAHGTIELEASGWGTRIRAKIQTAAAGGFWERFKAPRDTGQLERELEALLDGLGTSTLQLGSTGKNPPADHSS